MMLTPKTIEPGWAKRWTRQSVELFLRAPALAVGIMVLSVLMNAFIPQPTVLYVPITIFMVGILFSGFRAVDHDCGYAWSATWGFFRQGTRDLTLLTCDVFLFLLPFGVGAALFFIASAFVPSADVIHGAGAVHPAAAYLHLPGWLRHGTLQSGNMLAGIFIPATLPLLFLTMSVGNQARIHYEIARKATVLNFRLAYVVFPSGLLAIYFLTSLLKQIPSFFLGCALMAGFAAAFWWFGAWGYLWCREMFEGTMENSPATARQREAIFVTA